MQMPNTEALQEKWAPILDYEGMDPIKDSHRRAVTAVLLENQEATLREEREFLSEGPTNAVGNGGFTSSGGQTVAGFDPVLISLIRRAMPNLVAYDLAGVQPMSGPTGLIFAMRSRYSSQGGTEALFDEADTAFSGQSANFDNTAGFTNGAVGLGTTAQGLLPILDSSTLKVPRLELHTLLVRVCVPTRQRTSETVLRDISTRWHSRSRRSPLLLRAVL